MIRIITVIMYVVRSTRRNSSENVYGNFLEIFFERDFISKMYYGILQTIMRCWG